MFFLKGVFVLLHEGKYQQMRCWVCNRETFLCFHSLNTVTKKEKIGRPMSYLGIFWRILKLSTVSWHFFVYHGPCPLFIFYHLSHILLSFSKSNSYISIFKRNFVADLAYVNCSFFFFFLNFFLFLFFLSSFFSFFFSFFFFLAFLSILWQDLYSVG